MSNSILFFIVAAPIYIPTKCDKGSLFSISSPTLVISCGFDTAVLTGARSYLTVVLSCVWASFHIPVGHLYVFFRNMSIQITCPFLNWIVFVLLLISMSFYYVLAISPLLDTCFAIIFSHLVAFLFILLMATFVMEKLFSLM